MDRVELVLRVRVDAPQLAARLGELLSDEAERARIGKLACDSIADNRGSLAKLLRLIEIIEERLGKKAIKQLLPMQPGDVPATYADVSDLAREVDFAPRTPIEVGVERFVAWYRDFYGA